MRAQSCLGTTIIESRSKAQENQGPFPPDLPTPTQCMKNKIKKLDLGRSSSLHLLRARSAAVTADHADRLVADLHVHGEGGRELHQPPEGVARGDVVGKIVLGAVDEVVALLDDLLGVVPGTAALSRIRRGGGSSRRRRGSASAGESGGVARRSSSRVGDSAGGSSESRGVVVGANAAGDHVDGHEALVASEAETSDGGLDTLEQLASILRLLLVVRAGEVELVAADVVVPHDGASGSNAGGRIAHAVLVAAVLVADLLVGEVDAEDVVEDGTAVGPD